VVVLSCSRIRQAPSGAWLRLRQPLPLPRTAATPRTRARSRGRWQCQEGEREEARGLGRGASALATPFAADCPNAGALLTSALHRHGLVATTAARHCHARAAKPHSTSRPCPHLASGRPRRSLSWPLAVLAHSHTRPATSPTTSQYGTRSQPCTRLRKHKLTPLFPMP
jgi:hypothetical protein